MFFVPGLISDFSQLQPLLEEFTLNCANVNSFCYNTLGLRKVALLISRAFGMLDCNTQEITLPDVEIINLDADKQKISLGPLLRFWKREKARYKLLLIGHMDTTFPDKHRLKQAFRGPHNTLIGPGVATMKGGLAVMLGALLALESLQVGDNIGWEVIIVPDKSLNFLGSRLFLGERAREFDHGLVFEPTLDEHGTFARNRSGKGRFTIIVDTKGAKKNINAIPIITKLLNAIDNLSLNYDDTKLNITQLKSGHDEHIVPEIAVAKLDVSSNKESAMQQLEETLRDLIKQAQEEAGVTIDLVGGFHTLPKNVDDKTQQLFKVIQDIGRAHMQDFDWQDTGDFSAGNILSQHGLPTIDTMGVIGGKFHTEEEFIRLDSLSSKTLLTFEYMKQHIDGNF